MSPSEKKSVVYLGSIFSLRMFGLFLLLPILSLHAQKLEGATPFFIGLVMGAYGFTQSVLQIPYGIASDRFNRKHVIAFGLFIFMFGSVISALSEHLLWLIAGRAIQGAGAISAAILALAADLTRDEQRIKSMGIIGVSIGFTFLLSFIISPLLQSSIGVNGIFWLIAFLAFISMVILYRVVPNPIRGEYHRDILPVVNQLLTVLKDYQLLVLDISVFCLHMVLTALFVVIPVILVSQLNIDVSEHWKLYFIVILSSVPGMLPFIIFGSRANQERKWFKLAIALQCFGFICLAIKNDPSLSYIGIVLILFFSTFNALESMLPAFVSKIASKNSRGTAMSLYNSFQFMGSFTGGVGSGWIYGQFGACGVFTMCSVILLCLIIMTNFYKLNTALPHHI